MEKAPQESGIRKASGPRRVLAATRYSLQGLVRLWGEEAFRTEVVAFALGLLLFVFIGAEPYQYLIFVVLMLLLFCVEALNTAIEELVDRISPEISTVGRHAKDLGSFAVFCLLCVNGLFVLWCLYDRLVG
ncbi:MULTISPECIES: diacylglycerol kinase [Pseudorhizobium]|uniref:Diacylglycerol kinase n=1 Tax=Pseudorhizobium halotolerans TaxID=1233081 RepID=A0ABN7JK91_9HYPH|nr:MULTISPECIES: diacylglycerol kinase [Pseudorhizobium]CAD6605826.1 diacylglycerol kinase [Rhizobium sp. Khangiran2]CAD7033726.1 diacylglycerol kinase [Pseudorhizobium halotolerans]